MISKHPLMLFFVLQLLVQCKPLENNFHVRGRAYNSKAGAGILTKHGEIYFITNIHEWPKKYHGKKLMVKGKISILYDTSKMDNQYRQRVMVKRNIDSAKYRIVIFGHIPKLQKE